jgi:hypothetical protein
MLVEICKRGFFSALVKMEIAEDDNMNRVSAGLKRV